MSNKHHHILAKKSKQNNDISLYDHLCHVRDTTISFAKYLGMNENIAVIGAILHDIGKVHPEFQHRLSSSNRSILNTPHRHEITSILFLDVVPKLYRDEVIEMIIAHHKSTILDHRHMGILDLDYNRDDIFELHSDRWDEWSHVAIDILNSLGINAKKISLDDARKSYEYVLDYCETRSNGYSKWKGLLMGGDHLASALNFNARKVIPSLFKTPKIDFYNRKHDLFPLSLIDTESEYQHTLVTAPTGAGKTDFLIRRCKGRIFYILPFQASINAMYQRIINDIGDTTEYGIRKRHGASNVQIDDYINAKLQSQIGSSIKVLTPQQISSIVFATIGFETTLLDIQGCDIIFDEIHVYSNETKQLVIKLIEVLKHFDCKIHIGTATMPTPMYKKILEDLGNDNTYEVNLPTNVLQTFNRHIIHKLGSSNIFPIVDNAIQTNKKILVVANRISNAQQLYLELKDKYVGTKIMLIHSKFKRKDRALLEEKLISEFNSSSNPCIVVSTQVVEVSLDISFDVMITDVAPLDAMVQRFGRINRKRTKQTVASKLVKPIYLLPLPKDIRTALPYDLNILKRSYDIINDNQIFDESKLQEKLDYVFNDYEINKPSQIFKFNNGKYQIKKLSHMPKSTITDFLGIDGIRSIVESDVDTFKSGNSSIRSSLEITINSILIKKHKLEELDNSGVYVLPSEMYCQELGLINNL